MSQVTNLELMPTTFTRPWQPSISNCYARLDLGNGTFCTPTQQASGGGDIYMLDEPILPVPSYPPSRHDWDGYRAIFTQLYQVEDKPLKVVKEILEAQYGFRATERMYMKRITEWKVMKNYKKIEKETISRALQRRTQAGKTSHQVTIRDQPVKIRRILRHMKASAGQASIQSLRSPVKSVEDDGIEVRSPDPKSLLDDQTTHLNAHRESRWRLSVTPGPCRPIFSRDDLSSVEIMCFEGVKFFDAELNLQTGRLRESYLQDSRAASPIMTLINTAASLVRSERYPGARTLLNRACDELKDALKVPTPKLLAELLGAASMPHSKQTSFEVRDLFHKHATDLCKVCLGVCHPITVIMRSLQGVGNQMQVTNAVFGTLIATIPANSKSQSADTLRLHLTVRKASILQCLGQHEEAHRIIQQAYLLCTVPHDTRQSFLLMVLRRFTWLNHNDPQNHGEPEILFQQLLHEAGNGGCDQIGYQMRSLALAGLARIARRRGDLVRAENLQRKVLDIRVARLGSDGAEIVCAAHQLEETLREIGKHSEADLVSASYISDSMSPPELAGMPGGPH